MSRRKSCVCGLGLMSKEFVYSVWFPNDESIFWNDNYNFPMRMSRFIVALLTDAFTYGTQRHRKKWAFNSCHPIKHAWQKLWETYMFHQGCIMVAYCEKNAWKLICFECKCHQCRSGGIIDCLFHVFFIFFQLSKMTKKKKI